MLDYVYMDTAFVLKGPMGRPLGLPEDLDGGYLQLRGDLRPGEELFLLIQRGEEQLLVWAGEERIFRELAWQSLMPECSTKVQAAFALPHEELHNTRPSRPWAATRL